MFFCELAHVGICLVFIQDSTRIKTHGVPVDVGPRHPLIPLRHDLLEQGAQFQVFAFKDHGRLLRTPAVPGCPGLAQIDGGIQKVVEVAHVRQPLPVLVPACRFQQRNHEKYATQEPRDVSRGSRVRVRGERALRGRGAVVGG